MVMEDMEATMEVMAVTAMASALLMGLLGAAMKRDLPWPTLDIDIMGMADMVVTTEDTGTMVMENVQPQPNLAMDITVMEDMVVTMEAMVVMDMVRGMPMPHLMGVKQFRPNYFSH